MDQSNFLSLKVFKHQSGTITTDIYYKETNTHEYLHYDSHHSSHVKDNIPYCLAKTIIVSTSNFNIMEANLEDLGVWLRQCGYPDRIVDKGIFNARLQGPANAPSNKEKIPFVSTFYSNYDSSNIIEVTKSLITNSKNDRIQQVFENVQFIHAKRQPQNILQQITNAPFITDDKKSISGIFCCKRPNCKICKLYLQECKSFETNNGSWAVKCYAHCNSMNVLYFQLCNFCNKESNIGIAANIRQRQNNHISSCKSGNGSDIFDIHVYNCARQEGHTTPTEPVFKLYIMMVMSDYQKLRSMERHLHLNNFDTMNATNTYAPR